MSRQSSKPEQRKPKKLRIEIVWDASVPAERRVEYGESVRRAIRETTPVDGDGPRVVRARVSARGSGLHWELESPS
jgi:hypothetical protein